MIIDLSLAGKRVLVVGAGAQAEKRVRVLLREDCSVAVVGRNPTAQLRRWAAAGRISLSQRTVRGAGILASAKPDMLIATTDDPGLNRTLLSAARKKGILAYSSDSPAESDFANPALIDIRGEVRVAILAGGSPAVSRSIRLRAEKVLKGLVTREDVAQIRLQRAVRDIAKKELGTPARRKSYLRSIMRDGAIDQLIKDGQLAKAKRRAIAMLRDQK